MAHLEGGGAMTEESKEEPNGRFRVTTDKVLTVIVTVLLTWAAVQSRIAVLETQQNNTERRLQSIEMKIDTLLQRP